MEIIPSWPTGGVLGHLPTLENILSRQRQSYHHWVQLVSFVSSSRLLFYLILFPSFYPFASEYFCGLPRVLVIIQTWIIFDYSDYLLLLYGIGRR